jgi:sterol 3beta-glucosyltransferase
MHLTSHRLTFHASLPPPTSPGSLSKVLTSGPVYIHFVDSGIVMKRRQRVWLELTNEMISAYPGGAEDDRVRPLYSYLCKSPWFSLEDSASAEFSGQCRL